jgi:hypothetical protein
MRFVHRKSWNFLFSSNYSKHFTSGFTYFAKIDRDTTALLVSDLQTICFVALNH